LGQRTGGIFDACADIYPRLILLQRATRIASIDFKWDAKYAARRQKAAFPGPAATETEEGATRRRAAE
jgi:hypothetical protein